MQKLPVACCGDKVGVVKLAGRRAVDRVVAAEVVSVSELSRITNEGLVGLDDVELGPQILQGPQGRLVGCRRDAVKPPGLCQSRGCLDVGEAAGNHGVRVVEEPAAGGAARFGDE